MIIGANQGVTRPSSPTPPAPAGSAEPVDTFQASLEATHQTLEIAKKWQAEWKKADLWTLKSAQSAAPSLPALWSQGFRKLSRGERDKMKDLVKAGCRPAYARRLVEFKQTSMIDYILRQSKRGKKK